MSKVLGPVRDLGETRGLRSSQGHSSVSAARGRPSWPLLRKLSEASCAALTAPKRQAASVSFERASFHLLSHVQALQNTAAPNKPYPQPKNPSQSGPRQQKGAPGFRAGGSLGSTSAMRQRSSCLPCSNPCKHCGACRPFRHTLHGWHAR